MTRQSHLSVHPTPLSHAHEQGAPALEFWDSHLCGKPHGACEKPWPHIHLYLQRSA